MHLKISLKFEIFLRSFVNTGPDQTCQPQKFNSRRSRSKFKEISWNSRRHSRTPRILRFSRMTASSIKSFTVKSLLTGHFLKETCVVNEGGCLMQAGSKAESSTKKYCVSKDAFSFKKSQIWSIYLNFKHS